MGRGDRKYRKKILAAALFVLIAAVAAAAIYVSDQSEDGVISEDVQAGTVDLEETITAAGEVVTAEEEKISFDTGKKFRAMCVEENEAVTEGQHLIMYSNGTYCDAPGDGFVVSINAPRSGYYASSSNYITFAYSDKLAIDITVPEGEINEVSQGDKAEIVVNSDTSKTFTGYIRKKKALSTTQMGSNSTGGGSESGGGFSGGFGAESSLAYYTVSLTFDNDGTVLPGMSAICTIRISEKKDVLAVPIEAVKFDDEGRSYVCVVEGSSVKNVYVTTGDSDANYVEISDGLSAGDTVRIERKG